MLRKKLLPINLSAPPLFSQPSYQLRESITVSQLITFQIPQFQISFPLKTKTVIILPA